MDHLFPTYVKVTELKMVAKPGGRFQMARVPVSGLEMMRCRIDLQFLRPGKDTPSAVVAGAIPDREGIMFCRWSPLLKAGMQVTTVPDRRGQEVVKGTFEIKEIPDVALGFGSRHHIEVKVIESVQQPGDFPDLPDSVVVTPPPTPGGDAGVEYPYDGD